MRTALVGSLFLLVASCTTAPALARYLDKIERHLGRMIESGRDRYGERSTGLWLASVDIRQGGQAEPPPKTSRRTYRTIHAPHGSTLYWDQALIAFAMALSDKTGDPAYRAAAEDYIRDFLACCIDDEHTGMFEWGNHLYYDVFTDSLADIFEPIHEIRPMTPAWGMFWEIDPAATEREIRAAAAGHVLDAETGLFNRHALTGPQAAELSKGEPMPFLAAGGSLAESLAWLASQGGADAEKLTERALAVARYSFSKRDAATGLVPTQPVVQRWDSRVATTETGLWAGALLRAWRLTGREELVEMARASVAAYLETGWDAEAQRYYGMLRIADGTPESERTTEWQPSLHSDVWEPLFPSHDYPLAFAETCLTLWEIDRDERFAACARRWIEQIRAQMPPRYPRDSITDAEIQRGSFAENYGRAIHFLVRAARALEEPAALRLAHEVAADAAATLWVEQAGMFRSHPGDDRADAVDGLGYLFAALAYLETGEEWDLGGMAF